MLLIGHRGARGEAPENTLGGFQHLRNIGVMAVEFDIQVSADGELVVIHDASIDRTTLHKGLIAELTAAQLQAVDASKKAFPNWPHQEPVPTLIQVMEIIRDFSHVQFEVKAQGSNDLSIVADKLPALWQQYGFGKRAFTTSFNIEYLALIKEKAPEIPRGFLFEENYNGDPIEQALALACTAIGPHHSRCTPELIKAAHQHGLVVTTWTVNDAQRALELRAMGLDSLITDIPSEMKKALI